MFSFVFGCKSFYPPELVPLPTEAVKNNLDSSQASIVYSAMQHFPNQSQFALGFIKGDSMQFAGVRRQDNKLFYIQNKDSVFEIGSISKTFTATILAKLVYDHKINLDEPIKNILPIRLHQSMLNNKEVTLLHLANHTSGFPKEPSNISTDWTIPGSPYQWYDQTKLYDYLSNSLLLESEPGSRRSYSNLGGGLLGHLVTLIAGKPYETLLREVICQPLHMENTFVTINSTNRDKLVPGRDPSGHRVPNWELNVLSVGGGIKSTAQDLAWYLRAQMTDTTYFYLTQQQTHRYTEHNIAGLGWAWYADGNYKFADATGGTGGYSCIVIFERYSQRAVILLSNVSAFLASRGDYIVQAGIGLHRSIH
jgi:CubicO group peptidase (beta-lactamase class C family)